MTTLLLGLTTTWGSDWRAKVKEIDKFGIEEIALFVTGIEKPERQELYQLLEKTSLKYIRHTHLREEDMGKDEVDYLSQKWSCQLFNLHPTERSMERIAELPEYQNQIFIENIGGDMPKNFAMFIKESAGICLDISHYQDYGLLQKLDNYQDFSDLLDQYPIGCAHISAISREPFVNNNGAHHNQHTFTKLDQFDYVKDFVKYLPEYTSLELENSFAEQIQAQKYIEKLISS